MGCNTSSAAKSIRLSSTSSVHHPDSPNLNDLAFGLLNKDSPTTSGNSTPVENEKIDEEKKGSVEDQTPPVIEKKHQWTQRRNSKFFGFSFGSLPISIPFTKEMHLLENTIISHKQVLIQELIAVEKGDVLVKIRFIAAVAQCISSDDSAQKYRLAKAVVDMFVQTGGLFTIKFSDETTKNLVHGHYHFLPRAQAEILSELSLIEDVMKGVEIVENNVNSPSYVPLKVVRLQRTDSDIFADYCKSVEIQDEHIPNF